MSITSQAYRLFPKRLVQWVFWTSAATMIITHLILEHDTKSWVVWLHAKAMMGTIFLSLFCLNEWSYKLSLRRFNRYVIEEMRRSVCQNSSSSDPRLPENADNETLMAGALHWRKTTSWETRLYQKLFKPSDLLTRSLALLTVEKSQSAITT
jgi:hypothetical protein